MLKRFALASAVAALLSSPAFAQVKPEDVIKYRQGAYKVMGWNFGPMAAMVKGEKPYNKEDFARRADIVAYVGKLTMEGFTPGTDKGGASGKAPEPVGKAAAPAGKDAQSSDKSGAATPEAAAPAAAAPESAPAAETPAPAASTPAPAADADKAK